MRWNGREGTHSSFVAVDLRSMDATSPTAMWPLPVSRVSKGMGERADNSPLRM
jgi:hypothetical protein